MEEIIELQQQRALELTRLIDIQNRQIVMFQEYNEVRESSLMFEWEMRFGNEQCFQKLKTLDEAQTKLTKNQREEIDLLKGKLANQDRLHEAELEKMREAMLKLAFLASADCCRECGLQGKEKKA